jgi:hypothetical protein
VLELQYWFPLVFICQSIKITIIMDSVLSNFLLGVFFIFFVQIIRKVMKMDAAEPFNVPVNPEALGIPVSINLE